MLRMICSQCSFKGGDEQPENPPEIYFYACSHILFLKTKQETVSSTLCEQKPTHW